MSCEPSQPGKVPLATTWMRRKDCRVIPASCCCDLWSMTKCRCLMPTGLLLTFGGFTSSPCNTSWLITELPLLTLTQLRLQLLQCVLQACCRDALLSA